MKKSRYSDTQIVSILKEAEAGRPVKEICRKYGISSASYYNWKSKFGGLSVSELKRNRELETTRLLAKPSRLRTHRTWIRPAKVYWSRPSCYEISAIGLAM